MPGRTWVIAPDAESLRRRWQKLMDAPNDQKEILFHPHIRGGRPGDKHSKRVVATGLPGYEPRPTPVADESRACIPPIHYGFRSFDRQWILPDNRLINQPNPTLWEFYSARQVYLTALTRHSPSAGPAVTFTALIPDLHHYKGSFGGRAFPLWSDRNAGEPNFPPKLLQYLNRKYQRSVSAEDLLAYIAAVAGHPSFTARFQADLIQPGLRIPVTANGDVFEEASELGRTVIWLHTFGERFADPGNGRPAGPPRLPRAKAPRIPADGAISQDPAEMPDSIDYNATTRRLLVGRGYVDNIDPLMWNYEVSGKKVLRHWFSYRKANRERPIIGRRRPPSPLGDIQPNHWLAEYTTELINLLHVLGQLIDLEPSQADLLDRICSGPTITTDELLAAGALDKPTSVSRRRRDTDSSDQMELLD